jgi:hypothetical protein
MRLAAFVAGGPERGSELCQQVSVRIELDSTCRQRGASMNRDRRYRVYLIGAALLLAGLLSTPAAGQVRGIWRLQETSGTVATDSSLIGNNGTYTNGVVLAAAGPYPGAGLRAADFDGTNDYVATSNEYNYDLSSPMSVAAWIKVDSFTKQWQAIVTKGDSAWRLVRDDTNNGVTFACTGLSTLRVASVASGTVGLPVNVTRDENFIGRSNWGADAYYQGKMWDVRIYNRCLCPAEVQSLYTAGTFHGVKIITWVEVQ